MGLFYVGCRVLNPATSKSTVVRRLMVDMGRDVVARHDHGEHFLVVSEARIEHHEIVDDLRRPIPEFVPVEIRHHGRPDSPIIEAMLLGPFGEVYSGDPRRQRLVVDGRYGLNRHRSS